MYIIIPEEKKKLERIFRPYICGIGLREGSPKEAVDAYNKFYEWFEKELGTEQ